VEPGMDEERAEEDPGGGVLADHESFEPAEEGGPRPGDRSGRPPHLLARELLNGGHALAARRGRGEETDPVGSATRERFLLVQGMQGAGKAEGIPARARGQRDAPLIGLALLVAAIRSERDLR